MVKRTIKRPNRKAHGNGCGNGKEKMDVGKLTAEKIWESK
jgi:hypothetical protein